MIEDLVFHSVQEAIDDVPDMTGIDKYVRPKLAQRIWENTFDYISGIVGGGVGVGDTVEQAIEEILESDISDYAVYL